MASIDHIKEMDKSITEHNQCSLNVFYAYVKEATYPWWYIFEAKPTVVVLYHFTCG